MGVVDPKVYKDQYKDSHKRPEKLNRKVNGPFLDEIRKAEEDAYRVLRTAQMNSKSKKKEELVSEETAPPVAEKKDPDLNETDAKRQSESDDKSSGVSD